LEKQLELKFKGHPVVDSSFKSYTVVLFKSKLGKEEGIWVPDIWAKSRKQAIVKAAKKIKMRRYSMEDSLVRESR
jgi:hypothetical protein